MKRKLQAVPRQQGIYRVLEPNNDGRWTDPKGVPRYVAIVDAGLVKGKRHRVKRTFGSFAEAKDFRSKSPQVKDAIMESLKPKMTMTFKELTEHWSKFKLSQICPSTRTRYRSYLKHFTLLEDIEVESIDVSTIDTWICHVKSPEYVAQLNVTRCGFEHEFTVLRGIFKFYASRFNRNYRLPFLSDHNAMLKVKERATIRKDLSVEEFKRFLTCMRDQLTNTEHEVIYYIAIAQYAIYGRIQDAAALHFEDFDFVRNKIHVRRKVQWARAKDEKTLIVEGSKANGGKEIPMSDFASQVFREWIVRSGIRSGLLFTYRDEVVTYRQIIHRYDQALKAAGLPFTGTHLIRHASLSEHYDTCKDILATAKVAGHSDIRATERYAKARDERVIETQRQMDHKLRDVLPKYGGLVPNGYSGRNRQTSEAQKPLEFPEVSQV